MKYRSMKKCIIGSVLASMMAVTAFSQSGTNSPYSQYGLGILSDQSQSFSRGMNGVGLGLRKGNVVNTLNPASYSAVDSLTMMFDVALSGQISNFKEGAKRINAKNADFEYAVGLFRLMPHVGVSFGVLPYSNVGYQYSSTRSLENSSITMTDTYSGDGGAHQVFVGAGWRIFKPLSIGFNAAYLWGSFSRGFTSVGSESQVLTVSKIYSVDVSSYKLDAGLQWQQPISKKDELVLGLTFGLGHKLGADPLCVINTTDASTSVSRSDTLHAGNALELPMSYGIGLSWVHGNKFFVGADVTVQKWGSVSYPGEVDDKYVGRTDLMKDSYKATLGADYVPNPVSRRFLHRVHYKVGAGYATPYYKINGKDGPKELSLSAGFGIPLQNAYNNRSQLNVSAQWVRSSAKDMITDNTFRITVGLTFNERWFAKWKID